MSSYFLNSAASSSSSAADAATAPVRPSVRQSNTAPSAKIETSYDVFKPQ